MANQMMKPHFWSRVFNPWLIVDGLRHPWRAVDALAGAWDGHHRWLDNTVGHLKGKSVFFPHGFFPDGFGDVQVPLTFSKSFLEWMQAQAEGKLFCRPIDVVMSAFEAEDSDIAIRTGRFQTPFTLAEELLPVESHEASFQLVTPRMWSRVPAGSRQEPDTVEEVASRRPIAILLAGTGEQGFRRRRHLVARPLAKRGIASLILESPFYGHRRPPNQKASKLRCVSDLPVLGRATIEEAQSLVSWLRTTQSYGPIVLAGNSMGGLHAAMVASLTPLPLGVASWLGPTSAAPVFTRGVLSRACEWDALCSQAASDALESALTQLEGQMKDFLPEPVDSSAFAGSGETSEQGSIPFAKNQLYRFLQLTNLTNFPRPVKPSAALFVVAQQDLYVPAESMQRDWALIRDKWESCKIRWIRGGHVSGTIFPPDNFADCIAGVVDCLEQQAGDSNSHGAEILI